MLELARLPQALCRHGGRVVHAAAVALRIGADERQRVMARRRGRRHGRRRSYGPRLVRGRGRRRVGDGRGWGRCRSGVDRCRGRRGQVRCGLRLAWSVAFVLCRFRFLRRSRRRTASVLSRLSGRGGGRGRGGLGGGGGHELSLALAETALLPPFAFLLGLRGGLRACGQLAQERLNIALDRPRTSQEQFAQGRLATCGCSSSQLLGQRRVRRRRHSFSVLRSSFFFSSTFAYHFRSLSSVAGGGANRAQRCAHALVSKLG